MKVVKPGTACTSVVLGATLVVLSGCGNKGDLEYKRKPVAVELPSPVSVPGAPEKTEQLVGDDGVLLDITEVEPAKKKKKLPGE